MKRFVVKVRDGQKLYVKSYGEWTSDRSQAFSYTDERCVAGNGRELAHERARAFSAKVVTIGKRKGKN